MRKRLPNRLDRPDLKQLSTLVLLTVCFAAGVIVGCLFAGCLDADAQSHLSAYFDRYFTVLRDGETVLPSLFSTVWELGRWPLLSLLLGFTALGVLGIPVVFAVRGFLLSYAVAVFVRLFGGAGLLAALAVFGVSSFFALPALFILGVDALHNANILAGSFFSQQKSPPPLHQGQFFRIGVCCALLAISVAMQLWLTPVLLQATADLIL